MQPHLLATGCLAGELRLWDTALGRCLWVVNAACVRMTASHALAGSAEAPLFVSSASAMATAVDLPGQQVRLLWEAQA